MCVLTCLQDFDKFEMILQADEYEQDQGKTLDDFFRSTQGKFRTPLVQSWVHELTTQRATRIEQKTAAASAEEGAPSTSSSR